MVALATRLARCSSSALAPKVEIEKALKKYYGVGAETLDEMSKDEPLGCCAGGRGQGNHRGRPGGERHQVCQPDHLGGAIRPRDGHPFLEPAEDELRIRYRHRRASCTRRRCRRTCKHYQAALISRIKVMSGMNIAEKRLPQDGRINVRIKGEEIDIRASTVPTVYGESVFAAFADARQDFS